MAFTQLYYHVVFSPRYRDAVIAEEWREDLQRFFVAHLAARRGERMIAVYAMPDHVHLLFRLPPGMSLAARVDTLKTSSSKWVKARGFCPGFYWQVGYGGFSVSQRALPIVKRYIINQRSHHARQSARKELRLLLDRHEISYDDRFLPELEERSTGPGPHVEG